MSLQNGLKINSNEIIELKTNKTGNFKLIINGFKMSRNYFFCRINY